MLLFSKYSLSEMSKRKTSNNSSLTGNVDPSYSVGEEALKRMHFCGLRKPTLRRLLQFLDLVTTSPDKHKTLSEERDTEMQDVALWVWTEPKDLLVQMSCGGWTGHAAAWTKETAGGLTVELAWEIFTDG